MKKILFTIFAVAVIAVAAGLNVMQSRSEAVLSDVALENIEALAQSEGGAGPLCINNSWSICVIFYSPYEVIYGYKP
ncbi:MAG: NVEALA domain-containing protein [Tannerella sp.]|nr:NVEALA domain-containing protein [Tannerella sp.]